MTWLVSHGNPMAPNQSKKQTKWRHLAITKPIITWREPALRLFVATVRLLSSPNDQMPVWHVDDFTTETWQQLSIILQITFTIPSFAGCKTIYNKFWLQYLVLPTSDKFWLWCLPSPIFDKFWLLYLVTSIQVIFFFKIAHKKKTLTRARIRIIISFL